MARKKDAEPGVLQEVMGKKGGGSNLLNLVRCSFCLVAFCRRVIFRHLIWLQVFVCW